MKKNALLLAFGFAALGMASFAQAQTCASPLTPSAPPQSGSGDLCAGGATNDLGTLCGLFPAPANDSIYRFNIDGTRDATTITVTNNTPAWDVAAYVLSGTCGGGACLDAVDNAGVGANESVAVGSLTNGTYYLVITTSPTNGASAACGAFSWAANGRLPVQLQNFSIN